MQAIITEPERILNSAHRTLQLMVEGLSVLDAALDDGLGVALTHSVKLIAGRTGRVIVTGLGKSGHIGAKIAATLASTGTPASFVHAAEANHGDLGMITRNDILMILSWSGETTELTAILAYAKRFDIPVIAVTAGRESALGRAATVVMALPRAEEACPLGLAPTTSTLMQLALGDALAVALLEARGFTASDFYRFHPGGKLGASLTQVGEIMHQGEELPVLPESANMRQAILEMTRKGFGCLAITDAEGVLSGIITDGDLRRHMEDGLIDMRVDAVMTPHPSSVTPNMFAAEVLQTLNARKISATIVVDNDSRPIGIVHLHDLLRIGVA